MKVNIEMLHKFDRLKKIIGDKSITDLENKSVLVLGCGGVGGYVIESLVRSNIGSLIIVDFDIIDETNINRQIVALDSTIGKYKVDVFEERIKDINNNCKVFKIKDKISIDNFDLLFENKLDFFVDACDDLKVKKKVIKECLDRDIPFISSMGTGNKLDPSKLEIVDIRKTINDPLARKLRKFIKDESINKKVLVCSSCEVPVKTGDRIPGSTSFVPSSAGILISSYIINYFIKKQL